MNTPEDVRLDKYNYAVYKTWILAGLVGSAKSSWMVKQLLTTIFFWKHNQAIKRIKLIAMLSVELPELPELPGKFWSA